MNIEELPSDEEIIKQDKLSRVIFWDSRFKFLQEHCGLRPARMHFLLGTTGSGKSALTASVIADSAREGKVLIILSEENVIRYLPLILKANPKIEKENLRFVLESEIPKEIRESQETLMEWLEATIIEAGARIVFWDNLTTSALYSLRFGPKGQEDAILRVRDVCYKMGVAFFIVMHTMKEVSDNMGRFIQGEDVRGSQQSFIGADHFYILQRFSIGSVYHAYLRTVKHRGYPSIYKDHMLLFSNGIYVSDARTDFDKINEIFMKRNVLGKTKKEAPKRKDFYND